MATLWLHAKVEPYEPTGVRLVADAAPLDLAETDRLDLTFWLAALLGVVLTGLTVAIVLTSDLEGDLELIAVGRGLVIAVPVGVGLWLWRRGPRRWVPDG